MKIIFKIVLSIFLIFVLIGVGGVLFLSRGVEAGSKLEINNVSLSALDDGIYNGKYKGGRWSNEVKVEVKDHKIISINIVKDVLIPKQEVTKELIDKVIEKQNINVDTVAGATITSKAYLKAVENALRK